MKKLTRIQASRKQSFRRHYLKEWLVLRDMDPMDLWRKLNEADTDSFIDKKQVYRWLDGSLPHMQTQVRLAVALDLRDPMTDEPDPEALTRHPNDDWFARKTRNRPPEDVDRIKQMIDLAFPDRTGTNN